MVPSAGSPPRCPLRGREDQSLVALADVEGTGDHSLVTIPPDQDGLALRRGTVEWRPSRREAMATNLAGLLVAALGMAGYGALAISGHQPAESFVIAGTELLLGLLGMAAAVVGLIVVHEGIHGLAMLPFGARPSFGVSVGGGGLLPYVKPPRRGTCSPEPGTWWWRWPPACS